ncbi:MAG TPA: hypothetical protein VMZ28_13385, partial [Kofleriaceae bacterium]|nr:hypothetical protein [Kofleriaceae bacterium]
LVTGLEVLPDSAWSVEQVTLFALDSDQAVATATSLDAADAAPGYACLAGAGTPAEHLVTGSSWVDHEAGAWVSRLPAGTGLRLPAGRPLVLQVHYNLVAGVAPRDLAVALELDDDVVEAELIDVAAPGFVLAPGLPTTAVAGVVPLPGAMTVHAVYPRMRFLGHTLTLDLVTGPRTGCLAQMRHWDLHGLQKLFVYDQPIALAAGTTARVTCSYTTLGRTAPLLAGDGDADEECRVLLYVTPP